MCSFPTSSLNTCTEPSRTLAPGRSVGQSYSDFGIIASSGVPTILMVTAGGGLGAEASSINSSALHPSGAVSQFTRYHVYSTPATFAFCGGLFSIVPRASFFCTGVNTVPPAVERTRRPWVACTRSPLWNVGGVTILSTVTPTGLEVVAFPAASRATAVIVCGLFAKVLVFHLIEYGVVVASAPTFVPSTLNCTPTTPTLSEAVALMVIVLEATESIAGVVRETVGAMVSSEGGVHVPVPVHETVTLSSPCTCTKRSQRFFCSSIK